MSNNLLNNSFEPVLRTLRKGACLTELSEKVQAAVNTVSALNKPATITLVLQINPFGDGTYAIVDDIKSKLPVPNKGHTLFFATDDGRLVRDDPNQTEMKLTVTANPQPPTANEQHQDTRVA